MAIDLVHIAFDEVLAAIGVVVVSFESVVITLCGIIRPIELIVPALRSIPLAVAESYVALPVELVGRVVCEDQGQQEQHQNRFLLHRTL